MMLFDVSDIADVPKKKEVKKETKPVDFSSRVIFSEHTDVAGYDDFDSEKYPNGFVFYDFEVFRYDWMVVLIDPIGKKRDVIVNDPSELKRYYTVHMDNIWTGYNSLHYDVPILKGILSGIDPKEISDFIIEERGVPYKKWPNAMRMPLLSYDVAGKLESLKLLEAYMGNDIEETSVPFDIERLLTKDEIELTMKYCIHDVEQTIEVFRRRINDFNASMQIIEMFDFPLKCIEKTKGQLTAMVINCERKEHDDEFDITVLPCIQLDKYTYVKDWFVKAAHDHDYSSKLETVVCGIPHQFGWGGLHGASDKPVNITGKIYHADVGSYYPSMMIQWNLLTRNSKTPEKFKEVYDMRMALKKAGKKAAQMPLKIILNSNYGITKDKYSQAYDPVQANNICVNGQLMLLDLLEHLEYRLGDNFELIQSNTDGIIVKLSEDEKTEKIFRHICNNWCERTRMTFAYDRIDWYSAKDVNNYVCSFINEDKTEKFMNILKKEFPEIYK